MRYRILTSHGLLAVVIAVLAMATTLGAGQAPAAAPRGSAAAKAPVPRTPDGSPDLQGVWDFRTITPMERPTELADKATLTERGGARVGGQEPPQSGQPRQGERAAWSTASNRTPTSSAPTTTSGGTSARTSCSTRRTSLVVDPPDGRIPPLTDAAQKRAAERRERGERLGRRAGGSRRRRALHPRASTPARRCCRAPTTTTCRSCRPTTTSSSTTRWCTTRASCRSSRSRTANLPQWNGDSRGRWDGDTLVVETKNFSRQTSFPNSSEKLQLVERFTRVDADTLIYEFTVNDPSTWTKPWTAADPDDANRRDDVRVRLPRGELRHDEPAQGRTVPREEQLVQVGQAGRAGQARSGEPGRSGAPAATPNRGHANPR